MDDNDQLWSNGFDKIILKVFFKVAKVRFGLFPDN